MFRKALQSNVVIQWHHSRSIMKSDNGIAQIKRTVCFREPRHECDALPTQADTFRTCPSAVSSGQEYNSHFLAPGVSQAARSGLPCAAASQDALRATSPTPGDFCTPAR